jgi:hypothetical protein
MAAAAAIEIKWAMRLGDEQSGEEMLELFFTR